MGMPTLQLFKCAVYLVVCCAPALCDNISSCELSKNEINPLDSIGIRSPSNTDSIRVFQDNKWILLIQQVIDTAPHPFSCNQWIMPPIFDAELILFVGKRKWIATVYPKSLCISEFIRLGENKQDTRLDMTPGYCIEMDEENESEFARLLKLQNIETSKTSSMRRMNPKTFKMLDSLRHLEK